MFPLKVTEIRRYIAPISHLRDSKYLPSYIRRGQRSLSHEGDKKSRMRDACVSVKINFPRMRIAADWSDLLGDIPLCRSSRHFARGLRTQGALVKRASSWCRGVAAWERGAKARLVSVAARHGAFGALLLMIMVFCRLLLLCIPCKETRGRKRGARQDCDARA